MSRATIKTALRLLPYGVYVLGVEHDGEVRAATITWMTQSSFEPPLIVLGVKKDGRPYGLLKQSRKFAVSLLEAGQREIAFAFFKTATVEDGQLAGRKFETVKNRAPILAEAMGWLEGEVVSADETGDHAVVIGRIVNAGVRREGAPLTLGEIGLKYGG